jgi:KDO2-lipid IV(A) lauroyltransferase
MVERHQRRAHAGELGEADLKRAVHGAFNSYARYWIESFRLPGLSPAKLEAGMSYEGMNHLDEALAGGKGAIMALPHLGGWDWGGAWMGSVGYPMTVVVEPLEPPEVFEWFADFRRSLGLTIVPLGHDAGPAVLRALGANQPVGLLCDRDLHGDGVPVEFFGEQTTLPAGPVTIALRTGAPLLPTAVYFEGSEGHRGVIRPPLPLVRQGRLRADVAIGTQQLAGALEELIRAAPEQWHLMQPNWPSDTDEAPEAD